MFGVLVVKNKHGELGYLCAVSGKLAGSNQHQLFVPPVFDILIEDGFFKKGEAIISEINEQILAIENSQAFIASQDAFQEALNASQQEISSFKLFLQEQKEKRDALRSQYIELLSGSELEKRIIELNNESIAHHYQLKKLKKDWNKKIFELQTQKNSFELKITDLKEERKQRSAALQEEIFEQFFFLNKAKEKKSVGEIFKKTKEGKPPSGAGECAAPKLFQHAFLNDLEPIALAEFWWGKSPKTEVRIHGQFYPACRGKCEPILQHMLQGLSVEKNPLQTLSNENKTLEIIWEDDYIIVVNKPCDMLSVPGKSIDDAVSTRLKLLYPFIEGPVVVHRLDMSTSGLIMAAKTSDVYRELQKQFTQRVIKKRYLAVLEGTVKEDQGTIELPLRVDLDDRPRQMVCYEYGKPAKTVWKVIKRENGRTWVHFFPITGRTHQLRVHAAHPSGLNCPIVGDDLYGTKGERLLLHAEFLELHHPITKEPITLHCPITF